MKLLPTLVCAGSLLLSLVVQASDQSSEQAYQRCAACHMADGSGVPGVFPPLKNRIAPIANTAEGRHYLAMVVQAGLMGNIDVQGISYFGVMPAQGSIYDAKGIAEVLNYLVESLGKKPLPPTWQAFTPTEVAQTLASKAGESSAQQTAKMRRELFLLYPELNEMAP